MKTSELIGAELDYWVARAEGYKADQLLLPLAKNGQRVCVALIHDDWAGNVTRLLDYSGSWTRGGPLIERELVGVLKSQGHVQHLGAWTAITTAHYEHFGPTPLIAAMRAVVASKFGNEVEEVKQ